MRTRRSRAWSAIPDDVLTDLRLSPTARLVLAYCLGRPDGWHYHSRQICTALGIGRDAWRAARRQLEQVGYMRQEQVRGEGGRWAWDLVVTDTPASDGSASAGNPGAGGSSTGGAGDIAHVYVPDVDIAAAAADAAAPRVSPPTPSPGGKARRVRASGLVTWVPADELEAARLEAETPAEDLAAAVAAVRAAGREPVPGLVAQALERLRQRQQAEAAAAARRSAAAEIQLDPAAVARGARLLPPALRARALRLDQEDNTRCAM